MSDQLETDDLSRDDALADAIAALPANAEVSAEPVEAQPAAEVPSQGAEPAPAISEPQQPGTVPLATLIAERQRRKAIEAELAELRQRAQAPQQPQAPSPQQLVATAKTASEPPPKENIAEYLLWQTEQQATRLEAHEKELQDRVKAYEADVQREQQQRVLAEQTQQLDNAYQRAWAEAAGMDERTGQVARPEMLEAYKFFGDSIIAEAMAAGYDFPTAKALLVDVERREAWRAFSNELNPAELIVARARARGWTPGQATRAAAVQLQPAVAAPAPAAAPAADQGARRAAAGSKLSAASGAAAPTMPTLQEITSLSRDEYGRWKKRNPDGFEKLIGRVG
jgi:hypothetical protein